MSDDLTPEQLIAVAMALNVVAMALLIVGLWWPS